MKRRTLLGQVLAASGAPAILRAQQSNRVVIDPSRIKAQLDRRLFGSFLEHLGRAIYQGIYEPGSPQADSSGFRKDVLDEIKTMGVPIIRYPGGNFVSGYNWLDGVGPREKRPRVHERAWNSIETNQFGVNEFLTWCRLAATEPLLAVNLGWGTPEMAAALVEYCNFERGTKWSDLRREHGFMQPHNVRYWCLGNEMDGPWQIGHMTAREYGRKAVDAARQMRAVDRSLQLIACGSSSPGMPTFLEWDREVLEESYPQVDAISLHRYYSNAPGGETKGDSRKYLAMNLDMEQQIDQVAAVCDYVQKRLRSSKRLWLSFDEWNVWYRARSGDGKRHEAPQLLEEIYNLEDALLAGGLLNTLMRRADRVRIACLAQLVNVIAPLMTDARSVVRQTIYYPYAWALAHCRGQVLDVGVEAASEDGIANIDAAVTFDPAKREYAVLVLNRHLSRDQEVRVVFRESTPAKAAEFLTLTGNDLKAANTFDKPKNVLPQKLELPLTSDNMVLKLPRQSYSMLRLPVA
ncbi:MAG: alpha-N-arabinofuranosidase [Acidobacteria bacterium]|nr:alpha-N-arabinofuranosidase [Acidobacteriota bacterium]